MAVIKAKTKTGQRPCVNKGLRALPTPSFQTRETLHMRRKAPCGSKVEEQCQATVSLGSSQEAFEIHLGWRVHAHPGEGPRVGQLWQKKSDNWPEERQGPGRTAVCKWLDRLFPAPLPREAAHSLSLWVCISALLLSYQFLFVLSHLLCYISNDKLYTCIYSLYVCDKRIFSLRAKIQGKLASNF